MLRKKNDKALEGSKIFPYVAWGITFIFAYFVYNIVVELKTITNDLQTQTKQLQNKVNVPVSEITDFEL